ncbi:MAG: AbrB/MazE/SpoVT family DNA-binding domain-containing protein [Thermoflavifilum sp.]|nr:AbrB/MazE/SpoVT family DNA-binding domain-containing protein [Thermoflavifilum sp.]MCL6513071.1 AbrB/MazE/SpoVT family DNA-binding domain-containing protein [Alicyclobacillus sp.]
MVEVGITRRLDQLGRIVLPMELRRVLDIHPGDSMEVFTTEDAIVLRKYWRGCVFCGNMDGLIMHRGRQVCPECVEELRKVVDGERSLVF